MTGIIKRVFSKKQKASCSMETVPVQTSPLSEEQLVIQDEQDTLGRPAQLVMASGQSDGMQRDHNEDTLFTLSSVLADGVRDISLGVCIVADGMGGHRNGKVASGVAARTVANILVKQIYTHFLDIQQNSLNESIQEIINHALVEAHKSVLRLAPGGGTTLTCALIIGEQVTIGHIGDSRAYSISNDGNMQQITKDHSLVQRMVELEEITQEEASSHPQRNVLLKALGQTETILPDVQNFPLPKNGHLLLCSDGLWGVVTEKEMLAIINKDKDIAEACKKMVETANEHGGPDNISVILVKCIG